MDQTLTTRYVSRFEPLTLHPRLHHREGFPIHYLPPREPPPRRICYKGVPNSSLKHRLTTEGQARSQYNPLSPLPKRDTNTNSTSHQRDQTPILNLYQRGSNPIKARVFTTSGSKDHKLSFHFSTKQDPNRIGQMIAQVWKTKCFDQRNTFGKIPNRY